MERSLSLLTDRIEVLRAAVRRARAQHPFQNIPAAGGATLFRPSVMKMCRYLCRQGGGEVFLSASSRRTSEPLALQARVVQRAIRDGVGSRFPRPLWEWARGGHWADALGAATEAGSSL